MGLLNELENIKFASAFELIKNEESYDKSQEVISGLEAFYLCHKRYTLLKNILKPIKEILGEDANIISVNFNSVNQDETVISIKYSVNNKLHLMVVNMFNLEILEVTLSDVSIESETFQENYQGVISQVILELDQNNFLDNSELSLKSSSKKFIITDNCNDFTIKSSEEKLMSIGTNYYLYDKEKSLFLPDRITSSNDKLKDLLMDEENIKRIYSNLRIYEEDLPKELIKKLGD